MRFRFWVLALFCGVQLCLAGPLQAEEPQWITSGKDGANRVHLYFFWSPSYPLCREARPWIEVTVRNNLFRPDVFGWDEMEERTSDL